MTALITVRVRTAARRESFKKISGARYAVDVREQPERNAANRRVRELVSEKLGVPLAAVRIVSGHRRPSKVFSVRIP